MTFQQIEAARERLARYTQAAISRSIGVPVRWGRNDCALWCANVIRRALGYDPAASWRGTYSGARTARSRLGPLGLLRAVDRAAKRHGWRRLESAEQAEPGDLALIETPTGPACVLYYGRGFFVGKSPDGVTHMPARSARIVAIWSVLPCLPS